MDKRIGFEKTIQLLKDAGFDAYDYSFFYMRYNHDVPLWGDDYVKVAYEMRATTDKIGLPCNQAHAPFPSSCGDELTDRQYFDEIVRTMEIASILGAKIIVVHPKQHIRHAFHAKKLKQMNLEFYKALLPYAEKFNIKIATENMWTCRKFPNYKIFDSVCASPEEFCDYVDSINSPYLCACLDLGHVPLVRRDVADFIQKLGSNRLLALHVHDNDLIRDLHTLPYLQKMDYTPILKALGEINYQGDFTFEANELFAHIPTKLLLPAAKLMAETGRYMISKIPMQD
ncbi:MAG: sugar phosphate isomerase/epimerase [Clostridia bacterium]|nr:sugar phosphate isomerase/epimerase [Clostridia bacterium]